MSYGPLSSKYYASACLVKSNFDDNSSGSGTGVIGSFRGQFYLLTVRHNVDPSYRLHRAAAPPECTSIEISYRGVWAETAERPCGAFDLHQLMNYQVTVENPTLNYAVDDSDLVLVPIWPNGIPAPAGVPIHLVENVIATPEDLRELAPGESVGFVGFPVGRPNIQIDNDNVFQPAIYRQGVLAIVASVGVEVPNTLGNDYGLVDSFALNGFSGAPLYSLPRGEINYVGGDRLAARGSKLIGLICSHYRTNELRADGAHSGISYFVRSTSILDLLDTLNPE